jgi:hypothetical protein
VRTCQENYLKYLSAQDDFYTFTAPLDPRLPGGGGYRIIGLNTPKANITGVNAGDDRPQP